MPYSNEIDASLFADPSVKNNLDLVNYVTQAFENRWGYVWGTFGEILTPELLSYKIAQYPAGVGGYADYIRAHSLGKRTADCAGLVKGYGWYNALSGAFDYGSNGVPDLGADAMYRWCVSRGAEHGRGSAIPEIPGLILWKKGHTAVYIGGGYSIEAVGTLTGIVRSSVELRGFAAWYKMPWLRYR
ncbi:MAG: hypothetical protein II881_00505 [Oscillospiraceae bacterium]|nr:hypothetical protein [Oscillospiraceae bacterium]